MDANLCLFIYLYSSIGEQTRSSCRRLSSTVPEENILAESTDKEKQIETTSIELESFFIVKSILRTLIDSNRITYRDAQSYFAILLDDNNRKTICRVYLNKSKKYVGIFDSAKKETKNEIQTLDDIYTFSEQLKAVVT